MVPGSFTRVALALIAACALWAVPASAQTGRIAMVQPDGSLRIGVDTVRLYGVYIPMKDRTCDARFRPVQCRSRAAQALDLKIQGFVYCDYVGRNNDGTRSAFCAVDCVGRAGRCREDLGAWLISQGWAVAAPNAPFEYGVQEEIARRRGFGIWGFQADSFTFR